MSRIVGNEFIRDAVTAVSFILNVVSLILVCHFARRRSRAEGKILEKLQTIYRKS